VAAVTDGGRFSLESRGPAGARYGPAVFAGSPT